MKKLLLFLILFSVGCVLYAQQKHALVIGNSNYTGISRLTNPVNDANDMETALRALGFTVTKVLNGSLEQMENAVLDLRRRLGTSRNSYGFFYYAGHGVQSNGENYLIPIAADNIRSESQLRDRAVSLQFVLDSLSEAGNELNMVVLDACRDNPFGWARSGSRGLSVVSQAPTGSIVMYATGANSTASDGSGRNGLFTGHLLNNLRTQGLSVFEVFDKTMGDVISNTNGNQHPELSLRFAGAASAYLGSRPVQTPASAPTASSSHVSSNPFISNSTGWSVSFGTGSTGRFNIGSEYIDGRLRDVLTFDANVARDSWIDLGVYNDFVRQRLRFGNGVRFKVLGDGRNWVFGIVTTETEGTGGHHQISVSTRNGRVVEVDIPYSRLRQPNWVTQRIDFNKFNIHGMQFHRNSGIGTGATSIKIFDFEVY